MHGAHKKNVQPASCHQAQWQMGVSKLHAADWVGCGVDKRYGDLLLSIACYAWPVAIVPMEHAI